MKLNSVWVFDLDDTLYLERDYVASGFKAVASAIATKTAMESLEIYDFLWGDFCSGVRGNAFDRLFENFPQLRPEFEISTLVEAYRNHTPTLSLLPGMQSLLESAMEAKVPLGLITDGWERAQQLKVEALKLEEYFDPLVRTGIWGREFWKPHPKAYELVEARYPNAQYWYIGDNPEKDFVQANQRGWKTIRLRVEGQLRCEISAPDHVHASQFVVHSVDALNALLMRGLDEN